MLSTMSLDSLFLSLLISRPAVEKIRSDGMDVEGTARTRLTIIEILYYFNSFFFHHSQGSQSCDGLCYCVIKLQNCLFCCGVANIIVYLRRVNNRCLEIKSTQTKTHLWQLSPIVVFSSAKSLVLKDVMLPRCVIILKYFLNEIVLFLTILIFYSNLQMLKLGSDFGT